MLKAPQRCCQILLIRRGAHAPFLLPDINKSTDEYSIYYDKDPIDKLLTHSSDSVGWIALRSA